MAKWHFRLVSLTLGVQFALAGAIVKCTDLAAVRFGSEVKIESAAMVAAIARAPEHCDVRGTIWPENRFRAPAASVARRF